MFSFSTILYYISLLIFLSLSPKFLKICKKHGCSHNWMCVCVTYFSLESMPCKGSSFKRDHWNTPSSSAHRCAFHMDQGEKELGSSLDCLLPTVWCLAVHFLVSKPLAFQSARQQEPPMPCKLESAVKSFEDSEPKPEARSRGTQGLCVVPWGVRPIHPNPFPPATV